MNLPHLSISNSGRYVQVLFEARPDTEGKYLLIQCDLARGAPYYIESHDEVLRGHFEIEKASLNRESLRIHLMSRPPQVIEIRFRASEAEFRSLKKTLAARGLFPRYRAPLF